MQRLGVLLEYFRQAYTTAAGLKPMVSNSLFGRIHMSQKLDRFIVSGHRRMQNVTNYFLVNLSFADLMMSCLNTIFNFIFMKNR